MTADNKTTETQGQSGCEECARLKEVNSELLAALLAYRPALSALSRVKDGKTLFEGNPIRDPECGEAWEALDRAGKLARAAIASAERKAQP